MSRYKHHKYTWQKRFGSVRHQWQLIGPDGGIHFHASLDDKYPPSCGLEIHYLKKQGDDAPSQVPCWLLHAPCWHDGTSLYANDHLWPMIEGYLRGAEHDQIFRILEREADSRFGCKADDGN
jgi:hypothetical protein